MSEFKHTPGPWAASCFMVKAANGREVTHTGLLGRRRGSHDGQAGETEDEVNARLIAAAPEMLAALVRAKQFIENGIEFGYIDAPEVGTPEYETCLIVLAAIAKATGKDGAA